MTSNISSITPRFLPTKKAAEYLGIHPTTLWRWVESGALPGPIKLGHKNAYPIEELDAFIERAINLRDDGRAAA